MKRRPVLCLCHLGEKFNKNNKYNKTECWRGFPPNQSRLGEFPREDPIMTVATWREAWIQGSSLGRYLLGARRSWKLSYDRTSKIDYTCAVCNNKVTVHMSSSQNYATATDACLAGSNLLRQDVGLPIHCVTYVLQTRYRLLNVSMWIVWCACRALNNVSSQLKGTLYCLSCRFYVSSLKPVLHLHTVVQYYYVFCRHCTLPRYIHYCVIWKWLRSWNIWKKTL